MYNLLTTLGAIGFPLCGKLLLSLKLCIFPSVFFSRACLWAPDYGTWEYLTPISLFVANQRLSCTFFGYVDGLSVIGDGSMISFALSTQNLFLGIWLFLETTLSFPSNTPKFDVLSDWRSYLPFGKIAMLFFFLIIL